MPTLEQCAPRFMEGYCKANQLKPSGVAAKETILRVHLVPAFGSKRLDTISTEAVQRFKGRLSNKAPKTVNNVLTVLNVLLNTAVDWRLLDEVPCKVKFLPVPVKEAAYHDFDRLVDAAGADDAPAESGAEGEPAPSRQASRMRGRRLTADPEGREVHGQACC